MKFLQALLVITILIYGVICFEYWQRPEGVKKMLKSVDTSTAPV